MSDIKKKSVARPRVIRSRAERHLGFFGGWTPFSQKGVQGVSIYFVLIIMTIILAMVLGISAILIGQIKMIKGLGNSVIAFYAADTGIERELYERNYPPFSYSGYLDNDSSYEVQVLAPGPDCDAQNLCIKSVGTFKETKRAIEIKY